MARPARWNAATITRMPMGQSVAVTVLQMHQAMSVIASGGILLQPQIVLGVNDTAGTPLYRFERNETRRVISERTARTVAQMLAGCVLPDGTAPLAAIPGFEVAGKTGTTQKYMPEVMPSGKTKLLPSKKHHVASFVGFFPASRPQVAISVIIDDADAACPGGVAYGGKVAAPSFKRIGEQLIPILDIKTAANTAPVMLTKSVAMQGVRP
ncbi:MAG: penicillin-binding transpeptidase domain-containing protein [Verrucomicrobia bacterium]|nr:penicillin-binding transpeptidase domain-containing protein [Verrucomicrobiota bacterium]